jgi:hypothetical protein
MRFTIALASLAVLAGAGSAHAELWCGFHDKTGAAVRCGFTTLSQCHDRLGSKDTICVMDPEFARRLALPDRAPPSRSGHTSG